MVKFNPPRRGVLLVIALLLNLCFAISVQFLRLGFPFFRSIWHATGGWITMTLSYNLIGFALIIGACLLGYGRLSASSLGLVWKKLPLAATVVAATWVAGQIIPAVVSLVLEHRLVAATGQMHSLSDLIGVMFGNSLMEETFYRGYLISVLLPYLRKSTALAVLCSALIFGVVHIPTNIIHGYSLIIFLSQILAGVLFGCLYIRTENLWLCIGLHSFFDAPALLWASPVPYWLVTLVVLILCVGFGPKFRRLQGIECDSQPQAC